MTITVHHLGISQSERVVWACEELGLEYELVRYERSPFLPPPEYKLLHPLGAAPVITDGDMTLAESAACVEYLCQTYGGGRFIVAPGEKNYVDFLYWFHFANGTLMPTLTRNLALNLVGADKDSEAMKRFEGKQVQVLQFVDQRLSSAPWLAGDEFSAADIMAVASFTGFRHYLSYDLGPYPNILAYLQRVTRREAYRRAKQKADPGHEIKSYIGPGPPQRLV